MKHNQVQLVSNDEVSVQFSSIPQTIGSSEEHERRFSRDPLPVFPAGGRCEQFWRGQGQPFFDVIRPVFFFCRPRRRPPFRMPWTMILVRLSWRVTYLNHVSSSLLAVACGPARKLILLCTKCDPIKSQVKSDTPTHVTSSLKSTGTKEKIKWTRKAENIKSKIVGNRLSTQSYTLIYFRCKGEKLW